MNDVAGHLQIGGLNPGAAESEFRECAHNPQSVFGGRTDEEVEVGGVPGNSVEGNGEDSHNKVLNFVRVERREQLAPVFVERHRDGGGRGVR